MSLERSLITICLNTVRHLTVKPSLYLAGSPSLARLLRSLLAVVAVVVSLFLRTLPLRVWFASSSFRFGSVSVEVAHRPGVVIENVG